MIANITIIEKPEDYLKLWETIPQDYLSTQVMDLFRKSLSPLIKTVFVEYPYVDKDYRSTYYNFYSKRHGAYDKFCFRLHFFEKSVKSEEHLVEATDTYLGSIVLRPTEVATLGRTLLSPRAIRGFEGFICETTFENSLLGVPLQVSTFPHIMQDTDVSVCAHAVCWMIARYYSQKYSIYPERLSFDIAEAIEAPSEGRMIPSRGVTLGQVCEVLTSIGFYPEIFIRNLYEDVSFFYDILYSYVESGIPVVAAMSGKEHAVAVLGHGATHAVAKVMDMARGNFLNARHCSGCLIINDDNYLPFGALVMKGGDKKDLFHHTLEEVDGFVVPLYEKMYLSSENVLKLYEKLACGNLVDIPKEKKYVVRVFMTSSPAYKRRLREFAHVNDAMQRAQLELPMPQFIWLIELASPEQYDQMKVEYRWLIDATANQYERFPFLFIHDSKKMIVHDRALSGKIYRVSFSAPIEPFPLFEHNLRRYR